MELLKYEMLEETLMLLTVMESLVEVTLMLLGRVRMK